MSRDSTFGVDNQARVIFPVFDTGIGVAWHTAYHTLPLRRKWQRNGAWRNGILSTASGVA